MRLDQGWASPESSECAAERRVPLVGGRVEAIVRRQFTGGFPNGLHGIEFGRVGGQAEKGDAMAVLAKPLFADFLKVVARPVVDDEKDLATGISRNEQLQKSEKRFTVEFGSKLIGEPRIPKADGAKDMGGLPLAEGVDARLKPDSGPGPMEGSVEPETGFILEENCSSASGGFFLIAGNRFLSQSVCLSRSARANRLRGRCTEKPSLFRR